MGRLPELFPDKLPEYFREPLQLTVRQKQLATTLVATYVRTDGAGNGYLFTPYASISHTALGNSTKKLKLRGGEFKFSLGIEAVTPLYRNENRLYIKYNVIYEVYVASNLGKIPEVKWKVILGTRTFNSIKYRHDDEVEKLGQLGVFTAIPFDGNIVWKCRYEPVEKRLVRFVRMTIQQNVARMSVSQ